MNSSTQIEMQSRLDGPALRLVGVRGALAALWLSGFTTWAAEPALPDEVVFPTGAYPADLVQVRRAVVAGGNILLKATDVAGIPTAFNFGPAEWRGWPEGGVFLIRDVAVTGETVNGSTTTIRGGFAPFRVFSRVHFAIRGLRFEGPMTAAVYAGACLGADFSDNIVSGVVGMPYFVEDGHVFTKAQGVWFVNDYYAYSISGQLRIANNVIEDMHGHISYGVALYSFGADTDIVGNHITGVNSAGVLVVLNTQPVQIRDNLIIPGPARCPEYTSGNGIWAADNLAPLLISDNTVTCENPLADGIGLLGEAYWGFIHSGSVIQRNHVTMLGSLWGGITLYGTVLGAYVGQNQIGGDGAFAFLVTFVYPGSDTAEGNTFVGNQISRFRSSVADVFLDELASNTALAGHSGTVIDLGTDNRITGFTKLHPAAHFGQQIRRAQKARHELMKRVLAATAAAPF